MLAVELTSLEALSPPATGHEDNNHCTSGGAPLELWCVCLRLSARPFSLSCDSGTNRLAIWTESSHDFEMKYFLKKYFI